MASTKDVLDHHIKCFGEGDLTGILSDYASDAVLFTPDGPLKGLDAIRPFFEAMLAEFGKPGDSIACPSCGSAPISQSRQRSGCY